MVDFFRKELPTDPGMKLFGGMHLAVSAVFLVLCVLLYLNRKRLQKIAEKGHYRLFRTCAAALLIANMAVHYTARILIGEWHIGEDLPFHICFVTNFFMMYILLSDNRRNLYRVVYYFTFIGPLPAVIFPDLHRGPSGWVFYQFIISHHVMLLISLYCLWVAGYRPDTKGAVMAFFIGNAYVGLMAVFNSIFDTNYVMLGELPAQLYEVFPFLKFLPAVVWLELVGIAVLAAARAIAGKAPKKAEA